MMLDGVNCKTLSCCVESCQNTKSKDWINFSSFITSPPSMYPKLPSITRRQPPPTHMYLPPSDVNITQFKPTPL